MNPRLLRVKIEGLVTFCAKCELENNSCVLLSEIFMSINWMGWLLHSKNWLLIGWSWATDSWTILKAREYVHEEQVVLQGDCHTSIRIK